MDASYGHLCLPSRKIGPYVPELIWCYGKVGILMTQLSHCRFKREAYVVWRNRTTKIKIFSSQMIFLFVTKV